MSNIRLVRSNLYPVYDNLFFTNGSVPVNFKCKAFSPRNEMNAMTVTIA